MSAPGSRLDDSGYLNWVRSTLGLLYLKEGLHGITDTKVDELYDKISQDVLNSLSTQQAATGSMLVQVLLISIFIIWLPVIRLKYRRILLDKYNSTDWKFCITLVPCVTENVSTLCRKTSRVYFTFDLKRGLWRQFYVAFDLNKVYDVIC